MYGIIRSVNKKHWYFITLDIFITSGFYRDFDQKDAQVNQKENSLVLKSLVVLCGQNGQNALPIAEEEQEK